MKNLTIAKRIVMMIVIAVAALLVVGFVGVYMVNKGADSVKLINEDSLPSIKTITAAQQEFMLIRVNVVAHVVNTEDAKMQPLEKLIEEHEKAAFQKLKDYEKLLSNDEDKKLLEADVSYLKTYMNLVHTKVLPLSRKNQTDAALRIIATEVTPVVAKAQASFEAHVAFNEKLADTTAKAALASAAQGKTISLLTILVGFITVSALGYRLASELRFRMDRLKTIMEEVNQSLNFTTRISISRNDELGLAATAFNNLLDKLQGNLKSIATGAQTVAAAANQMAATSTQVATAAHQQSEASSGMAATVEEMTVSINHVGDRAQEANRISSESGKLAVSGEQVIGQTAHGINAIAGTVHSTAECIHQLEQHSSQISSVISVIKEIADQTNLLALNAAIEAARAGEQGRGFAVVADEVRKLAERTSTSTQEIARTIETMRTSVNDAVRSMEGAVAEVNQGVERAQEANNAIRQIGAGSRTAVGMVEEITVAIREQGMATNNIAAQVERIAQMSEESSAAAEESARAARDLDRVATEMHKIVAAYTL